MRAVILAAGRGSRMKEKTDILPKCLTVLWGHTLLEWQIRAIRSAGISDIAIVTGYHAEEIKSRTADVTFFHNGEWMTTNMVATLIKAEPWLKEDACLVCYADILYEPAAIRALMDASEDAALLYNTDFLPLWKERFENPLEDLETFRLDGAGRLVDIGGRAADISAIEGQYMGLLRFTPAGWEKLREKMAGRLPKPLAEIDMTGLLSYVIKQGVRIQGIPYAGLWLEVDSPEDLAVYEGWPENRRARWEEMTDEQ